MSAPATQDQSPKDQSPPDHPIPDQPSLDNHAITAALLAWFNPEERPLDFRDREGLSPWAILLSEVMAQQTQADRAAAKWREFLNRWPTVHDMAQAARADIIAAWSGLGYNRRAVNLHACAQVVSVDFDGNVPDSTKALEALPGIGPYTARAVMAFAFRAPTIPVDTNIARVMSRLTNTVLDRKQAQVMADALVQTTDADPARLTDALMDLGATICMAKKADCPACPLAEGCSFAKVIGDTGLISEDPAAKGAYRPIKQAKFAGSDRQLRGAIVRDLTNAQQVSTSLLVDRYGDHVMNLLDGLARDGLVTFVEPDSWSLA